MPEWKEAPPDESLLQKAGDQALGFGKGVVKGVGQDVEGLGQVASWLLPQEWSDYLSSSGPVQSYKSFVDAPATTTGESIGQFLGQTAPYMAPLGGLGLGSLAARAGGRMLPALGRMAAGATEAGAVGALQPTEHGTVGEHLESAGYGAAFRSAMSTLGVGKAALQSMPEGAKEVFAHLVERGVNHLAAASIVHHLTGVPWFLSWMSGHEVSRATGLGKKAGDYTRKFLGVGEDTPKPQFSKGEFGPKEPPDVAFKKGQGVVPREDPQFQRGQGFSPQPVKPPGPPTGSPGTSAVVGVEANPNKPKPSSGWKEVPEDGGSLTVPHTGLKVTPQGKGEEWTPSDPQYKPQPNWW